MQIMIHTRDNETIVAQCTPKGSGALALIRLSGDNALEIAQDICTLPHDKKISEVASHTIHFGHIIDRANTTLDQVMLSVMHAPKTFTGQHVVEITCHNNPFIVDSIIQACIEHGARLARNGEFSMRAFLNGKIDLIQAEAINELINAQTQVALYLSMQSALVRTDDPL